jgi:hypothetical protein
MRFLLAVICCLVTTNSYAAIGSVSETKGSNCQIERNKQKLPGDKGAEVESMDTYITGGCISNITFKDDTKVKITENSRLLIDDFVFDPKQSDAGKLALKVGMGTVRYASGQIAKSNPQQVNIKTPTAAVAVRGTDFNMTVDESGQSLVILVPSCKDEVDVKKYELEENKCKVGKIEVSNTVGTVELNQAFQATYVQSDTSAPSPPTVVNIIESKISNNLIIVKPIEIQKAVKEAAKSPHDKEIEEIEAEATRRMANRVAKEQEQLEEARILRMMELAGLLGCNPVKNVCVLWDKNDADADQLKGKGIAFRISGIEHYSEIKTIGYNSNTNVSIIQNDDPASSLIGNGEPGGNIVIIKQNNGVLRPK